MIIILLITIVILLVLYFLKKKNPVAQNKGKIKIDRLSVEPGTIFHESNNQEISVEHNDYTVRIQSVDGSKKIIRQYKNINPISVMKSDPPPHSDRIVIDNADNDAFTDEDSFSLIEESEDPIKLEELSKVKEMDDTIEISNKIDLMMANQIVNQLASSNFDDELENELADFKIKQALTEDIKEDTAKSEINTDNLEKTINFTDKIVANYEFEPDDCSLDMNEFDITELEI